jgi:nucleoid-associated protein YgaU
VLTVAASLTDDERIAATAERFAPGRARRWAAGVTSLGLLGSVAAATASTDHAPMPRERIDRRPPSPAPSTTTTTAPAAESTPPPAPPISTAPLLATPVGPEAATTWTVARGDHLWGIAESTLRERRGPAVSEDDVRRYWTELVERNRDRLADPSNPDLIFAGQVFVLPPG